MSVLIPGANPAGIGQQLARLVDEICPDEGSGRRPRSGDDEGDSRRGIAVRMVRFVFEELGGANGTTA